MKRALIGQRQTTSISTECVAGSTPAEGTKLLASILCIVLYAPQEN